MATTHKGQCFCGTVQLEAVGENEQAMSMYKDVVTMTPRDDEYNEKARKRLANLEKQ